MDLKTIRIAFMGTPDFAVPALKALVDAGYQVVACYSQPPRPTGRGHKVQKSPVQLVAESYGIPTFTPASLRNAEAQAEFKALKLDVAIVAAYGLILPLAILESPLHGCVNIHGSLLPRWRGAAPIHRAMLEGDTTTGITIMQMDEGLDTGPMILKAELSLPAHAKVHEIHDQMAQLGAEALLKSLQGFMDGSLVSQPQPEQGVSYAAKLLKEEGRINWSEPAEVIATKVRVLNPWPGVWFDHGGIAIKVLDAQVVEGSGQPGEVLDDQLTVACGVEALRLLTLQKPGKSPTDGPSFLRGYDLPRGTVL